MSKFLYDVAILTDDRYEHVEQPDWYVANIFREEELLAQGLTSLGLSSTRVSWSNASFDWSRVGACVFRSTWDYFERFAEFSTWLAKVSPLTRLINSENLVRWNWDKKYLIELDQKGIAVPKTILFQTGEKPPLREIMAQQGWESAIFKPAISGAGRHTYLLHQSTVDTYSKTLLSLLESENFLLQEFLKGILDAGEISLILIQGQYSHAVRKIGKPGDFRVHDDHGGSVHPHDATSDEIEFAENAAQACPELPLYARVDLVRDSHGQLKLMELELIEPELFFRFHEPSAQKLAHAIALRNV